MKNLCRCLLLMFVVPAVMTTPALAQDVPAVEVSGGYNLLKFSDETLPTGWYADVAGNVTKWLGIVGQVDGNYKTIDVSGVSVKTKLHGFMGGVRINARENPNAVPFVQALFGAMHTTGSTTLSGLLPFEVSNSETDSVLQLGGGVNLMPAGNIGVRVAADYMRIFVTNAGTNVFRFGAGVVIPLGKR